MGRTSGYVNHVVAISGGKDSTAMALRLREIHPDRDYQFVITPTGDELPDMYGHWERLERLLDSKLIRVNTKTLLGLIDEQGMIPNFRARFCTRMLKIDPFLEYVRSLDGDVYWYVGIRAGEESRGGVMIESSRIHMVRPLVAWGWGLTEVLDYLRHRGVEIPRRTDCGACFYQRLHEWYELWRDYPDRYLEYEAVEERMGHTFRSPSRDSQPASLRSLREKFENGYTPKQRKTYGPTLACSWCAR